MRTAAFAILALVAAERLAAQPRPGLGVVAQSPHFVFYAREASQVDVEENERFVARLERLLGRTVSGQASYYRYEHPIEIEMATGTYARGITFARSAQIHSTLEAHPHEIVHWVVGGIGDPGDFFQEGLAVALTADGRWRGESLKKIARRVRGRGFRVFLQDFARLDPEVAYPVAGAFAAQLIRDHGVARVVEFFEAAGREGRDAAFARIFGRDLVSAGEVWLKSL